MAHDGGGTPHDLAVQTWIMYAIGILLFLARVVVRFRRIGFRLQPEDYFMFMAIAWYTIFIVTNVILSTSGGGSLYPPGLFETFTDADIRLRVKNSKIEFLSEQANLNTVYSTKACMLFIYYRITTNSRQALLVNLCIVYTALGFVATQLTLFFNCRPFSGYWTLPPPQEECATYFRFEVIQAVFNISSDLVILSVIIPVLWKLKLAKQDKLPLVFVFSLGFALVICAIVSKIFTFRDIWDTSYQFWYLREASCCIYITNLPYIWGYLRQELWSTRTGTSGRNGGSKGSRPGVSRSHQISNSGGGFHQLQGSGLRSEFDYNQDRSESEEKIIETLPLGEIKPSYVLESGKIMMTTEIHVSRDHAS